MNPPFTSADYRGVVAGGGGRASRGRGRHLLGRHQHGAQTPRRRTCRAHRTLRAVNQLKKQKIMYLEIFSRIFLLCSPDPPGSFAAAEVWEVSLEERYPS